MRSKVFISVAVVIITSAIGLFGLNQASQKDAFTKIQLANIEALSNTEGSDEGTPVGKCVFSLSSSFETGWFYLCDDRTTTDMIYSCPKNKQFGWGGFETMCTK